MDHKKTCTKCGKRKEATQFYMNRPDCKTCKNTLARAWRKANMEKCASHTRASHARSPETAALWQKANRQKRSAYEVAWKHREQVPSWADRAGMIRFYEAAPPGMHVDHIIPLHGDTVSGLHVLANLQYLTPSENRKKGNTWISV